MSNIIYYVFRNVQQYLGKKSSVKTMEGHCEDWKESNKINIHKETYSYLYFTNDRSGTKMYL